MKTLTLPLTPAERIAELETRVMELSREVRELRAALVAEASRDHQGNP